jgi:ABC transport system ATP-binding/permease protein
MLGLTISALVPNSDRSVSIVPLVVIPQVIFSGVIFSLDNPVFLQFLAIFFPARWAMAAMGSTVGLHGDKLNTDSFSFKGTQFTTVDPAKAFPGAFFHLLLTWGVLVATILVLGITISWLLKRKDARS